MNIADPNGAPRPGATPADFDARYRTVETDVMREVEMAVIGSDYGAISYTTLPQADLLAERLHLDKGMTLLDVGCGAGWPGLYLARSTGCSAVVVDLPREGLRVAASRMRRDGIPGGVMRADGVALPLRDESMDAATSSDVFC